MVSKTNGGVVPFFARRLKFRDKGSFSGHALRQAPFHILFANYSALLSASRIARYLEDPGTNSKHSTFSEYRSPASVRDELVKKRLYRFEQKSLQFLSDDAKDRLSKIEPSNL